VTRQVPAERSALASLEDWADQAGAPAAKSNEKAGRPNSGAPGKTSRPGSGDASSGPLPEQAEAGAPQVAPYQLDEGFGLIRAVSPEYPQRAKRLGKGGEVRVELAIAVDGNVERIRVLRESGGWGFGRSVRQAYRQARFSRPTVRGRPVRVLWRQTVIFRP
jgi:TonB family protein